MNTGASLRVESVTVDFPVYDASMRSLRNRFIYHGTGGRMGRDAGNRLSVRALDDVSLDFEHGDRVGIVGHNGAGKTTLLRVLAGVYEPVRGRVRRTGRTASLLDVSLGIDYDATGYENIVTRGLLLGLATEEIRERTAEIAAFTELGDYLAMPARTYSPGMRFRLSDQLCSVMIDALGYTAEIVQFLKENIARKNTSIEARKPGAMRDLRRSTLFAQIVEEEAVYEKYLLPLAGVPGSKPAS